MSSPLTRALTGTTERPQLCFTRVYRATPDEIRAACTKPERLRGWFGAIEGNPARVGDTFTAHLSDDPDDSAVGEVLGCEPDAVRVSWSWQDERPSVITVRWRAVDDEHTELSLHHALAESQHAVGYGGGWEQMLQSLARSVDDADASGPSDAEIESAAVETWRTMTRHPLEVTQRVEAPRADVWRAFTSVEGLRSWWWRHWADTLILADAQVGGEYRIEAGAAGIVLDGRYLVVDEPHQLAFTWVWRDADGQSSDEAVDIRFEADGDATLVHVRHTGPWAETAPVENYRQGWTFTLAELAAVVGR